MSGGYEQQREPRGRRGWWLVGSLAVIGAAVGAYAGSEIDPDVSELVPSLAVAGFGLGGLIGLLLLAPIGVWRAWRRRARRPKPTPEHAEPADDPELWHTSDPEPAPESEAEPDTPDEQTEPDEQPSVEPPALEPPPPEGEEPGWYVDPRDGERRYWDGHAWTGHVWRGRTRDRKPRSRP